MAVFSGIIDHTGTNSRPKAGNGSVKNHFERQQHRTEMTQLPIIAALLKYADRLKFPQLFLLTTALFVIDLLIPDIIPFADELLLGLLTLLLGSWRKTKAQQPSTIKHTKQDPQ
jgi:hypothetical protein